MYLCCISSVKLHGRTSESNRELKQRERRSFDVPEGGGGRLTDRFGSFLVGFPFLGDVRIEKIVGIRCAQQSLNRQKDSANL